MAEQRRPRVIKTRPEDRKTPTGETPAEPASTGGVKLNSSKVTLLNSAQVPAEEAVREPAATEQSQAQPGAWQKRAAKLRLPVRRPAKADPALKSGAAEDKAAGTSASAPAGEAGAKVLAFPVPEYKRRRRTVLLAALAVAATVAVIVAIGIFSPALALQKLQFEGTKLVKAETLVAALEPLQGTPLPQITEEQVAELLKPVVQVKSSRIAAHPPNTLVVKIVERVPVALLKNGKEYLLVDPDGVQLGTTGDPAAVKLPIIDGGKAAIGNDTFRAMTAVLANLPQSILAQLASATAKSPDAVELKLNDGREVIWGSAEDMDLKAKVLQALLQAPEATAAPGKPAPQPAQVFDVSAPRHPVTR